MFIRSCCIGAFSHHITNYVQRCTSRHRLRRIAHAKGERLPEEIKGTHHTKALPIDDLAQKRILEGRASKKVRRAQKVVLWAHIRAMGSAFVHFAC